MKRVVFKVYIYILLFNTDVLWFVFCKLRAAFQCKKKGVGICGWIDIYTYSL